MKRTGFDSYDADRAYSRDLEREPSAWRRPVRRSRERYAAFTFAFTQSDEDGTTGGEK